MHASDPSELDDVEVALLPSNADLVRRLAASRERFVASVARRVRDRAEAEEIVQAAFARTLETSSAPRSEETAIAWFHRLLKNAIIDRARRRDAERRAIERHGAEPRALDEDELERAVCACVKDLLGTLRPEHAALVERVDLDGVSVEEAAQASAITPGNARVRLHRARKALRVQLERACGACATHGCIDCSCGEPGGCATSSDRDAPTASGA